MSARDYDDIFEEAGFEHLPTFPDLSGKTVFVTGGGSGIGAFLVAAFAMQGAKVGFVSLTKETANRLCDSVEEKTGERPLYIQCDIRDVGALRTAIDTAISELGPVDILVNNAARDTRHKLEDWGVEEWDESINTNLRPLFFAAQVVAPSMKKQGGGAIINVGSNSVQLGLSGYPAYVTAKAGIDGMTRALARELGPSGIRVNTLVPGWVLTERQKRLWVTDDDLQACLDAQCLKSPLNGWDVAGPALFLASSAAGKMTGQQLIVDGGRV